MGKSYSDKVKSRSNKHKASNYDRPKRKNRSVEKPPFPFAPVIVIGIILTLIAVSVVMYANRPDSNDNIIINDNDNNNDTPTGSGTGSIILDTTDGGKIFLDQYKGKVIVLDLFATWCGPCKTQMEELDILKTRFSFGEMVILSVGVDLSESMGLITEFKRDEGATWTFARSSPEFNSAFPSSSIPTLYILDKDGNMGKTHVGVTGASILESDIRSLL